MSYVRTGVVLTVAAGVLTVGCSKSSKYSSNDSANGSVAAMAPPNSTALAPVDSSARVAPGVSAGMPTGMPPDTGAAAGAMPSADAGLLSTSADIDSAEVAIARFAEAMATSPSVKTYARMLAMDHERDLRAVDSTASKLSFGTPMMSSQVAGSSGVIAELRALPKGLAFDTAFVDRMVSGHESALITARQNEKSAQAPEVKAAIRREIPMIQRHLDRAKALQTELAKK